MQPMRMVSFSGVFLVFLACKKKKKKIQAISEVDGRRISSFRDFLVKLRGREEKDRQASREIRLQQCLYNTYTITLYTYTIPRGGRSEI